MASGTIKDTKEIYASIFDHSPVVRKEVAFFLKEFEETRKDREVDRLFKVLERVTELKDTELSKTQALADIHLPKLALELQVAESIAKKLNQKRSTADAESLSKLEVKRKERADEWDAFVHDMTSKCIRIDTAYKEKQNEIIDVYKKAEDKLWKNLEGPDSAK